MIAYQATLKNPSSAFRPQFFAGTRVFCQSLLGALLLLSSGGADAKVLYVNSGVANSGDGTSWKNAYKYLRDALDRSKQGDQIYLAKGTYYPDDGKSAKFGDREQAFELDGQKIYGGFAGTETLLNQRNPQANPTSLSGAIWRRKGEDAYWSLHVVVVNESSTLDGVTVEDGHASGAESWGYPGNPFYDEGGGCYVRAGQTLTLSGCIVRNNRAFANGGAIMVEDDEGMVIATNSLFERNEIQLIYDFTSGAAKGGAIKGNVRATNCSFISNIVRSSSYYEGDFSTAFGGAISGETIAVDCKFIGNSAIARSAPDVEPEACGGAVYGKLRAVRCTFTENTAITVNDIGFGAGGAVHGDSIIVTNSFFSGNRSGVGVIEDDGSGTGGGGAIFASGGHSAVANCIFVNSLSKIRGGAIHADANNQTGSLTVANCTMLDNGVTTGLGAAISCRGVVRILNNIIWHENTADDGYDRGNLIYVFRGGALRNSDATYPVPLTTAMNVLKGGPNSIIDGPGGDIFLVSSFETILAGDPLFAAISDPDGADNEWGTADDGLRPGAGGSAVGVARDLGKVISGNVLPKDITDIDADGNISEALPLDILGVVRVQNSFVEMGAYEIGALRQSPEISVLAEGDAELRDGTSISFGSVAEFSSNSKTYIIKNVGTGVLKAISLSIKGSTRIKLQKPSDTRLSPGASMKFTVSFIPNEKGTKAAKLVIRSNDEDENPFNLNFSGTSGVRGKTAKKSSNLVAAASQHPSLMLSNCTHDNAAATTITLANGSKYLVLTVQKSANSIQQDPTIEVSSNLVEWYSGSKHTTTLLDTPTLLTVRDNTPLTKDDKRYIRLK